MYEVILIILIVNSYNINYIKFNILGLQLQLKSPTQASQHPIHASTPQTLQLQGLTVDPSKLTVLQELPEVGKVVVQETKPNTDSITTILEEMKVCKLLCLQF